MGRLSRTYQYLANTPPKAQTCLRRFLITGAIQQTGVPGWLTRGEAGTLHLSSRQIDQPEPKKRFVLCASKRGGGCREDGYFAGVEGRLRVEVPQPHGGVPRTAGQLLAVRGEGGDQHRLGVPGHAGGAACDGAHAEDRLGLVHDPQGRLHRHLVAHEDVASLACVMWVGVLFVCGGEGLIIGKDRWIGTRSTEPTPPTRPKAELVAMCWCVTQKEG